MANKLFRVNRTEDEDTSTAGPATITRADDPQLLPIVPLDKDTGAPDVADPVENRIYATEEEEQEILFVTDEITLGDFNPITSNAVAKELTKREEYSTEEIKTNKVWIDGKPIYRKSWRNMNSYVTMNGAWQAVTGVTVPDGDKIINYVALGKGYEHLDNIKFGGIYFYANGNLMISIAPWNQYIGEWMLEYTKTTD